MLHIIIGPMFSGKTTAIIRIARRYRILNKKVLFINHVLDNRYSKSDFVTSHNGLKELALSVNSIFTTMDDIMASDIIIIEEAQFFDDLLCFFHKNKDLLSTKHFVVSGLSGDYSMNPIGDILSLIPMADTIEKLDGLCIECGDGTLGCFTKLNKKQDLESNIIVGSDELYACVCRKHHTIPESVSMS
jgi:thymidine kinase